MLQPLLFKLPETLMGRGDAFKMLVYHKTLKKSRIFSIMFSREELYCIPSSEAKNQYIQAMNKSCHHFLTSSRCSRTAGAADSSSVIIIIDLVAEVIRMIELLSAYNKSTNLCNTGKRLIDTQLSTHILNTTHTHMLITFPCQLGCEV